MENRLPVSDPHFIERLIPQRSPFVMVSHIAGYSELHLISGFDIRADNLFVCENVFQASGLIEHQAQSVALHTGYTFYLLGKEAPTGYIGAIKSLEISALPRTGDFLETEVKILNEVMGFTLVETTTRLNGQAIATAQMKTVVK